MKPGTIFELTKQHVELLMQMNVCWEGDCEWGSASIDMKRPYGNSDVMRDVSTILEIGEKCPHCGEILGEHDRDILMRIHRSTEHALQIVLQMGSFETGPFQFGEDYRWHRVEGW